MALVPFFHESPLFNTKYPIIRHVLIIGLLLGAFFLSGCAGSQPPPNPSPPPPSLTPSPTIAFPTLIPTPTITPEPIPTATPDLISGFGELMLLDTFQEDSGWVSPDVDFGGTGIIDERFSLAVRQPSSFLTATYPDLIADNFYYEVKTRAEVCSLDDEYGILFRINPDMEHYRFTLTCDGDARVSRNFGGGEAALVPKTKTNAVLPGLLVENKLGVLVVDDYFTFFINGIEVFSVRDTTAQAGKVGLVVRSRQGGQTTAIFDDVTVYGINPTPEP